MFSHLVIFSLLFSDYRFYSFIDFTFVTINTKLYICSLAAKSVVPYFSEKILPEHYTPLFPQAAYFE
jgi:hypothetical protein